MVSNAIKKYDSTFEEILMFIAKGEADMYIKMVSVNEDSYGEKEGKRLAEKLSKAEEELKNMIIFYEKITINEEKIIRKLESIALEQDIRKKTIIGETLINELNYD